MMNAIEIIYLFIFLWLPGLEKMFATGLGAKHAFSIYSYIVLVACPLLNLCSQVQASSEPAAAEFSSSCRLSEFVSWVLVWFLQ